MHFLFSNERWRLDFLSTVIRLSFNCAVILHLLFDVLGIVLEIVVRATIRVDINLNIADHSFFRMYLSIYLETFLKFIYSTFTSKAGIYYSFHIFDEHLFEVLNSSGAE